ncbi:MAG: ribosomal RNA small subunit methyltransferase A [Parcubacteria group bacterium]|nr:ribosomal RNA small subunit methyltransferase A [Parcubacteria group bacterium]
MRAKKSLGQNFLKAKKALNDIAHVAELNKKDLVLEVGPGKGALTEILLEKAGRVITVEKDEVLVKFLEEKFAKEISEEKLKLITGDILNFNLSNFTDFMDFKLSTGNFKVAANIPYYITGQFLRKFLSGKCQPSLMVLMLQKEVAKRIVAQDNKESILSLSVKVYGTPKYVDTVEARYFSPAPKVDSAILLISQISKDFFKDISEEKFFEVMKAGFAHKRKQLSGNLKSHFKNKNVEIILEKFGIDKKTRAEDISLKNWAQIANEIDQ